MTDTSIQWTDKTWNPVRGCARVSPGCENCYAERQAHRFSGSGQPYEGLTVLGKHGPRWAGSARFFPEMLGAPLKWRKPQRVFVNSMSDLFHDDVTNEQIAAVFGVMAACPQHTFQVLTKRPERMLKWFASGAEELAVEAGEQLAGDMQWCHAHEGESWPLNNVHLGVSCEDQQRADERIPLLLATPAAVRFVSAEPLLGPILFQEHDWTVKDWLRGVEHLQGHSKQLPARIDWVIVGGESGPRARVCETGWIRSIVAQCRAANTSVFVKQLGAKAWNGDVDVDEACGVEVFPMMPLKDRHGGEMAEWPTDLQVREFPV